MSTGYGPYRGWTDSAGMGFMAVSAVSGFRLRFNVCASCCSAAPSRSERIAAAPSVHILAGVTFAVLYSLLHECQPLS